MKLKLRDLALTITPALLLSFFGGALEVEGGRGSELITFNKDKSAHDSFNHLSSTDDSPEPVRINISDSTYLVSGKKELLQALLKAKRGEIVYIDDSARIDLSDTDKINIPSGVTLASGRWGGEKNGALLYSYNKDVRSLLVTAGDNVRITGLHIMGPDYRHRKSVLKRLHDKGKYYSDKTSLGIATIHANLVVDHCELLGWGYAALRYHSGASGGYVAENYIHHNQRWGLGYGVVLDNAQVLIERNVFDWNRHAIAASGVPGTSYEARYNIIRKNARSHAFDMHGGVDRKDGTDVAGDLILVHHNIFYGKLQVAIKIRGRPQKGAFIYNNCFYHRTVRTAMGETKLGKNNNVNVYDNYFGSCDKKI